MRVIAFFIISAMALTAASLPLDEILKHSRRIDEALPRIGKPVDDATFLRRSYLTIIGRIPTAEEANRFLESPNSQKRIKLIEILTASPGHESHMFNFWADLLRVETHRFNHGLGWHLYIKEFTQNDTPYDEFVSDMLTATGHTTQNKAVGYYLRDRNMLLDNVSNTAQVFLGQQIGCAQCHDHPFDDVTQLEYYQLASFMSGLVYRSQLGREKVRTSVADLLGDKDLKPRQMRKQGREMRRDLISLFREFNRDEVYHTSRTRDQLKLPHDYEYNDAKPGDHPVPGVYFGVKAKTPDRAGFASWVTSEKNPYFTRVLVNRLWNEAYGQPLYPQLDDWSKPPSAKTEIVLKHLEAGAHASKLRVRDIMRILYHSRLFQAEAMPLSKAEGTEMSGPVFRRMKAEQLHDSLLTLKRGNVDGQENQALDEKWNSFSAYVIELIEATPEGLIERDKLVDTNAGRIRELRRIRNQNNRKAKKLRTEGDREQARAFQKLAADARLEGEQLMLESRMSPDMNMMRNSSEKKRFLFRASERPAPFRARSLVREFGGSDRQTPNSSHTRPSIPQLLSLLNGFEINRMISEQQSYYGRKSQNLDADAKMNHIFLSLYSRLPSKEERELCLPILSQKQGMVRLSRILISSQNFLFIQ